MGKDKSERNKPHVNVGTIDHAGHGKTTLVSAIVSMMHSRAMELVQGFWQQHTKSDALSMSMDELHADVERVIRAARSAPAQPVPAQAGEYPELPPLQVRYDGLGHTTTMGYGVSQMRAYADATCAARKAALAAPAQAVAELGTSAFVGVEPVGEIRASSELGVAPYADIWSWLQPGTKLYTADQVKAADSVLEDALRYRWLRINAIGAFRTNDGRGLVSAYHLSKIPAIPGIPEETDAAIDAAIAAQQGDKT